MNTIASKDSLPADPAPNPVSPVLQFVLLIVPMVMSCFFTVYALTGWLLEGRDKITWALESPEVAMWVGAGVILYSLLVTGFTLLRGGSRRHPLVWSSLFHSVLSVLLVVSVLLCVRM